jgi:hypothetical protein
VNNRSILASPKIAIAVKLANKRRGVGGAGMPAGAIGRRRRAKSGGGRKVGVIANAGVSKG